MDALGSTLTVLDYAAVAVFGASGALTFQLVIGLTLAYLLRRNAAARTAPTPAVAPVV